MYLVGTYLFLKANYFLIYDLIYIIFYTALWCPVCGPHLCVNMVDQVVDVGLAVCYASRPPFGHRSSPDFFLSFPPSSPFALDRVTVVSQYLSSSDITILMGGPSTAVVVDVVTSLAERGFRAFLDMRSSDVGVFPTSCVLLCLSELRDVYFHCNAIADAVDREGSDFSVLRLEDASWEAVRFWIVSHVRRVPGTEVGTSLSREQEFGPGLSRSVIVKISRRTEWLVDNRIERVYTSLWQLKRFIAVPSAPRGLDGIFLLRSGCAGFADGPGSVSGVGVDVDDVLHDDDVSRVVNVLAVSADSRLASLDGRAWQVVLALSGQQAALEDLIVFARSHFPALSSSAEQEASLVRGFPAGPAAVGELRRFAADDLGNMIASSAGQGSPAPTHPVKLHHELPADVLLRGVLEAWPDDDGYRAHCARHGVPSIAALTPFQVVVWLSAVCGLGRQPASGSKADLWRHAVLLRGVVYDVISGFDVVARSVGFSSIESMVAPYLLWHAKECEFLSLARPEDDDLFAPVSQGGNLWHAAGPVRRSSAAVAADVLSRTPAANKQLRVVAHLLHLHLYWCTRVDRLDGEPALVDLLTVARKRPSRASTTTTDEDGDASSDVVVRVPSDPGRSSQSRKGKEPVRVDRRRKPLSGRMSVADYRPPRWSGDLTEVPHVLKSVLAGLSAFKRVPVTSGGALKVGIGPSGSLRSRLCARGAMRASGVDAELAAGSRRGMSPASPDQAAVPDMGTAWSTVTRAMQHVAQVHVCPFQDLMTVHDELLQQQEQALIESRGDGRFGRAVAQGQAATSVPSQSIPRFLTGQVQLILTDPPYNIRRDANLPQSAHDILTESQMLRCANLFMLLLRPGGHLLVFCSSAQHPEWVRVLRGLRDRAKRGARDGTSAFAVDGAALVTIKDPHAIATARRSSTNLTNKTEMVVHATRCGASAQEAYEMVNYRTFNRVPSHFLAHDNVIDNVRPPGASEVVYRVEAGSRQWIRPEQKAISLGQELIERFSQCGDLVVDCFAGTCFVAAACLRLPLGQYRRVVCCDSDADVIRAALPRLRREFIEQVIAGGYANFPSVGDDPSVVAAAHMVRKLAPVVVNVGRGEEDVPRLAPPLPPFDADWTPPAGRPCHSALPLSVIQLLASRWARAADEERVGRESFPSAPPPGRDIAAAVLALANSAVGAWPRKYQCALSTEDGTALREHAAAELGLFLATSGLAGGSAGTGVFAARRFPAGVVVAPFFGAIIYTDLGVKLNRTVRYASSVLGSYGPTAQECSERALAVSVRKSSASEGRRVHVTETDNCSEDFTVWIVPSVCCVAGYVNDCTAVSKVDQAAAASSSHAIPRAHANVVIQVSPKVSGDDLTIDDLLAVDAVQLVACRDISPGEELVAWYGTEYDFLHDEEVRGGRASGGRLVSRSTPHTFAGV